MKMSYLLFVTFLFPISVFAEKPNCSNAQITESNPPLFAIQNSLFSHKLFQHGTDWLPELIVFKVTDEHNNPIKGCDVVIYPENIDDTVFYSQNTISDENGEVKGWWLAGMESQPKLVATVLDSHHGIIVTAEQVSSQTHPTKAVSPLLSYFGGSISIKRLHLTATPIESAPSTEFKIMTWMLGNRGFVSLNEDVSGNRTIDFRLAANQLGDPTIVNDANNLCKIVEDKSNGRMMSCQLDYAWKEHESYGFDLDISQSEENSLVYSMQVKKVGVDEDVYRVNLALPQKALQPVRLPFSIIQQPDLEVNSCSLIQPRTLLITDVEYMDTDSDTWSTIYKAGVGRPFYSPAGGNSLCYNYGYGNALFMPNNPTKNINGFYISTGGKAPDSRVNLPTSSLSDLNFIDLKQPFYEIKSQAIFDKFDETGRYLTKLFNRHHAMELIFDHENSLPILYLPNDANEEDKLVLKVMTSNTPILILNHEQLLTEENKQYNFVYFRGKWMNTSIQSI